MIIRRASLIDQPVLADLLVKENNIHHHLDWRTPYEWLGSNLSGSLKIRGNFFALAYTQEILPAA